MPPRQRKRPSAFKHGAHVSVILPGEDPREFEKLSQRLCRELRPEGVLEEDIVCDIARLMWRKQYLGIYRDAELARQRFGMIKEQNNPSGPAIAHESAEQREQANARDIAEARRELGNFFGLVEMGEWATLERFSQEFGVEERLDAMIDRCLRRLLYVRGLKSMSGGSSTGSSSKPAALPRAVS